MSVWEREREEIERAKEKVYCIGNTARDTHTEVKQQLTVKLIGPLGRADNAGQLLV